MAGKFSIKVISNSCGLKPQTLRAWEQRYGAFNPERTANGRRLYTEREMEKAKLLALLTSQGHLISNLANKTNEQLTELKNELEQDTQSKVASDLGNKKLLKHLLNYEISEVSDELQMLRVNNSVKEFIFKVTLPTLRVVGKLVAEEKYTVTQEHIISTLIREQLISIFLPKFAMKRREIALATPDGNIHELSITIADILCRTNRITTRYLGASHPAECLAEALNALRPEFLVLGAVSSDKWNYDEQMMEFLIKMDSYLDTKISVIIGGAYPIELPEFKSIEEVIFLSTFEQFDCFLQEKV